MRRNKHGFVEALVGMVMLAAYGIALVVVGLGYIVVKATRSDASGAPPAKQEEQQKTEPAQCGGYCERPGGGNPVREYNSTTAGMLEEGEGHLSGRQTDLADP